MDPSTSVGARPLRSHTSVHRLNPSAGRVLGVPVPSRVEIDRSVSLSSGTRFPTGRITRADQQLGASGPVWTQRWRFAAARR
jgi:hypothetical protein